MDYFIEIPNPYNLIPLHAWIFIYLYVGSLVTIVMQRFSQKKTYRTLSWFETTIVMLLWLPLAIFGFCRAASDLWHDAKLIKDEAVAAARKKKHMKKVEKE